MTPAQEARQSGFLASLMVRGVTLEDPLGRSIRCLVERVEPDQGEFAVGRETATACRLHILRTHLTEVLLTVGSVLREPESQVSYRVTSVGDNPASIAVVFTAEVASKP